MTSMPEEKNLKVKATEDRLGAYVYSIQEEDEEDEVMHERIERGPHKLDNNTIYVG